MLRRIRQRAVLTVLVLAATGCVETTSPELVLDATVLVVHASPQTPGLDVVIGNRSRARLAYAEASDRITVGAGWRRFRLLTQDTRATLMDVDVRFEPGARHTLLAAGRSRSIHPMMLRDDSTPADSGFARIRLINGAVTAGAVDIYVTSPITELSTATPLVTAVAFGTASDYIGVDATTYRVRVTAAGSQTVLVDLPLLELLSTQVCTVVMMDMADSDSHGLIVLGN